MTKRKKISSPAWLVGRRRRQLFAAISAECAAAGIRVRASAVPGIAGFASALEWLEVVTRHAAKTDWFSVAGDDVVEWAEALHLEDTAIARLLAKVGVIRRKG